MNTNDSGAQAAAENAEIGAGDDVMVQDEADLVALMDAENQQDDEQEQGSRPMQDSEQVKDDSSEITDGDNDAGDGDEITDEDLAAAEEAEKASKQDDEDDDDSDGKKSEKVEFSPEQQVVFDREINRQVAKRKALEEQLEAKVAAVAELEQKLQSTAGEQETAKIGLHPKYMKPDDAKLVQQADALEREIEFCKMNIDGYDDPEDDSRSVSAKEIRSRLIRAEKHIGMIGKANDVYRQAHKQMLGDIDLMAELRGKYDGDMDRLKADLELAQAVRKRRDSARKAAVSADKSKKNDPLPETNPATAGAVKPDANNNSGFNARRYASSDMTEEDLVASGF